MSKANIGKTRRKYTPPEMLPRKLQAGDLVSVGDRTCIVHQNRWREEKLMVMPVKRKTDEPAFITIGYDEL